MFYMVTRLPRFREDIPVTYIAERGPRGGAIRWSAMQANWPAPDFRVAPGAVPIEYRRAAKAAL